MVLPPDAATVGVFISEKQAPVCRTQKMINPETGKTYPLAGTFHRHGELLLLLLRRRGFRAVLPQVLFVIHMKRKIGKRDIDMKFRFFNPNFH